MKLRAISVTATAFVAATAFAVPAFANAAGYLNFATSDSSIVLSGGKTVMCALGDAQTVQAEFDVDGSIVSVNVVNGEGGVAITGETDFEGTVHESNVSIEEGAFMVSGKSVNGTEFILHGECSPTR